MKSTINLNGEWKFACTPDCTYETLRTETTDTSATVALLCRFPGGETVQSTYTVDKTGVSIEVCGNGEVAFSLPAFFFDGDTYTAITHAEEEQIVERARLAECIVNLLISAVQTGKRRGNVIVSFCEAIIHSPESLCHFLRGHGIA